jgi:hypothetical protein
MKAWFIIGLVGISISQPFQDRQDTGAPEKHQKVTRQSPPPAVSPPPCCLPTASSTQQAAANKTSYWRETFGPTTLANWALVFVGIGATIAALCTLRAIRRQAQSMRYQTTILRKSADATIASERAWVMVDLDKVPGIGTVLEGSHLNSSGEIRHTINARVRCICSNHGKTPARVIEKRCCLLVVTAANPLPQRPNLDIEITDAIPHYLGSSGESSKHDWTVTGEGNNSPGDMVVIYGVIKYKHLFSKYEAQTTFGYRVTPDYRFERLTDYPKYNENT